MRKKEGSQKRILKNIDDFARMQTEHIDLFAGGKLAYVSSWKQQRQNAFLHIKNSLDSMQEVGADNDMVFRNLVKEKVKQICRVEQLLMNMVANKCDATREKLGKLRKGKRALSGYSGRGKASVPRFLNSRS